MRMVHVPYRDDPSSRCIFKCVLEAASKRVATSRGLSFEGASCCDLKGTIFYFL